CIPSEWEFHLWLTRARILRDHIRELKRAIAELPVSGTMSYHIMRAISESERKLQTTKCILHEHFDPN
ncbi:MAG: hypothetical protein LPK79_09975, partial [Bacteroidota bacterium]|nr:hypothetical protein [Bacteroidota bacterium]